MGLTKVTALSNGVKSYEAVFLVNVGATQRSEGRGTRTRCLLSLGMVGC